MRPHGGPLGLDHGNADPLAGGLEIILWNGPVEDARKESF